MPYIIDFVDNSNGNHAHYNFFSVLRDFAKNNGWTEIFFDDSTPEWKTILRGSGLSGTEEIYIGLKTYQSEADDYYNIAVCGMIGYLPGAAFENQPNFIQIGIPLYKNRIDYWITLNAQRIAFCCKIEAGFYESGYIGKFFPYCPPSQYSYPVVVAGMFGYNDSDTMPTSSYGTTEKLPYHGSSISTNTMYMINKANNFRAFSNFAGKWFWPITYPGHGVGEIVRNSLIDTQGEHPLIPIELYNPNLSRFGITDEDMDFTPPGIYGALDGIYWISGWNAEPEDTLTIDGDNFVVFRDALSSEDGDFYAMKLDQ